MCGNCNLHVLDQFIHYYNTIFMFNIIYNLESSIFSMCLILIYISLQINFKSLVLNILKRIFKLVLIFDKNAPTHLKLQQT